MTVTLKDGVAIDDTTGVNQRTAAIVLREASPVDATAVATTAATSTTPFGYTEAQANAIVTQLNIVINALITAGMLS